MAVDSGGRARLDHVGLVCLMIFALTGMVLSAAMASKAPMPNNLETGQVATATYTPDPAAYSRAIFDAQDAISRTLDESPEGHDPVQVVARLVSVATLDDWRMESSPLMEPQAPAWLVGVIVPGLHVADAMPYFYDPTPDAEGLTPIDGIFYAWDANGGYLIGLGVLGDQWSQNADSLITLVDEEIPIVPATAVVLPTYTTTTTPDSAATP